MSEFHVEVCLIENLEKHPNADTLDLATVRGGYTCCVKSGQFQINEKVV